MSKLSSTRITAGISLKGGEAQLQEIIKRDIADRAFRNKSLIASTISPAVQELVSRQIRNSPTVTSLTSGILRDEFGLNAVDAEATTSDIISELTSRISVVASGKSSLYALGFSIRMFPVTEELIDKITTGQYVSSRGKNVQWLEWLLTRGGEVVLPEYHLFNGAAGSTRSGGDSIMIASGRRGDAFRIDHEHSGTVDDNFITRSIEEVHPQIIQIIANAVMGVIK
jgi:hypothetical protein